MATTRQRPSQKTSSSMTQLNALAATHFVGSPAALPNPRVRGLTRGFMPPPPAGLPITLLDRHPS